MSEATRDLRPIRTPPAQMLADFRRGPGLFLLWLAAVGGTWLLLERQREPHQYIGLAGDREYEISAVADGRLHELHFGLHDLVESGSVVAMFDSSQLEARLRTAAAEVTRLETEVAAGRNRMEQTLAIDRDDRLAVLLRYRMDSTDLRLEALQVQVGIETDRVEAVRLGLQLERTRTLVGEDVSSQAELDDVQLRHERLLEQIRLNGERLAQVGGLIEQADARGEEFEGRVEDLPPIEPQLTALRAAIDVALLRMREIEILREGLVLRSPSDARVSRVLAQPGQAVLAGEPILLLSATQSEEIVFYVPESVSELPALNSRMLVARANSPQSQAESLVTSIGPRVGELPRRLWRNAQVPEYGRPVLLAAVPALELVPGEAVHVLRID